jgi:putative sigma-54 modulation protein
MDISIRARNVEVPDALRSTVEEKVGHLGRFLDGMDRADVLFSEERNPRIADKEICEITLQGHGQVVRARAAAPDRLGAVDRVVDKLEHRLEKLKGRLVSRSHPRRPASIDFGAGPSDAASDDGDTGGEESGETGGRIVKTRLAVKPMTPEEAVLQMELGGRGFFFFPNAETGRAAVVYRRDDGDIGLIDAT